MSLVIDLRKHFTMAAVKQRLERAAVIQSTVMDLVFPPAARTQYDSPVIPVSEIRQLAHVMPVVARGAASVPITAGELDNQYVEPLPVRVNSTLKPVELNNLKLMGMGAREEWAGRKQEALRGSIRKTGSSKRLNIARTRPSRLPSRTALSMASGVSVPKRAGSSER